MPDLQGLMEVIAEKWEFNSKNYPDVDDMVARDKTFFAVKHVILHQIGVLGRLAKVTEPHDHGVLVTGSTTAIRNEVVKMVVNSIRLAQIMGFNAEELVQECTRVAYQQNK